MITGDGYLQKLDFVRCSSRYADYFITEIQKVNSDIDEDIFKAPSIDELVQHIHEFFLVTMAGEETVGHFRIFVPPTIPYVLELGSIVGSSNVKGIKEGVVAYVEQISHKTRKQVVAITGEKFGKTLQKQGWNLKTRWFPERMKANGSIGKELYIYQKR